MKTWIYVLNGALVGFIVAVILEIFLFQSTSSFVYSISGPTGPSSGAGAGILIETIILNIGLTVLVTIIGALLGLTYKKIRVKS